jgi:hypothetical protein
MAETLTEKVARAMAKAESHGASEHREDGSFTVFVFSPDAYETAARAAIAVVIEACIEAAKRSSYFDFEVEDFIRKACGMPEWTPDE